MMVVRIIIKKRRDKEDEKYEAHNASAEERQKRGRLLFILAVPVLAIIGIILFILTQDMRLPMIMIDWWTLAHGILFAGGALSYIFAYRRVKDEDGDDEQPAGTTSAA